MFLSQFQISQELCENIILYFKDAEYKWEGTSYSNDPNAVVDKSRRYSIETSLNDNRDLTLQYNSELSRCVNEYIEEYKFAAHYGSFGTTNNIKIQYYPVGASFSDWHCERSSKNEPYGSRHLVFMTYLNDVTDGGETEFYYQQVKFQPKKGLTLIWPADWTFTHRGLPSETQEKCIITGWMNYNE